MFSNLYGSYENTRKHSTHTKILNKITVIKTMLVSKVRKRTRPRSFVQNQHTREIKLALEIRNTTAKT